MLQLDSSTVAGKTAKLVAAFAGAKVSVTEKSGAAVPSIATPSDGTLEGLATVCKYVASLAAPEKALAGSTPEQEAQVRSCLHHLARLPAPRRAAPLLLPSGLFAFRQVAAYCPRGLSLSILFSSTVPSPWEPER